VLFREFAQSHPYSVRKKVDASGVEHRENFLGRDAFWGGSTWPDMCCAVGDAVHNMRSALDHIAYAVALSRRRPPKDLERIAFVVRSAGKEFNLAVGKRIVRDVGPDWIAFMRRKQSYYRRNGKDLLRLILLDNMDKHRQLLALAPLASVSIKRSGKTRHFTASLKEGVLAAPVEPDPEFSVFAPYITLTNSIAYNKRQEASFELLGFRDTVTRIVMDADKEFVS